MTLIIAATSGISFSAFGQKKVRTFTVEREFDLPAEQVWKIVGESYGAISNTHPTIISSGYINGTTHACEGAERVCHFNEDGTKFLKETMLDYNEAEMSFTNKVTAAGKFPVDPDYTQAVYKVEDLGNGRSKMTFDMQYRTKPAIMGWLAQGKFESLISDYLVGVEHHIRTGELVSTDNIKEIKKQYESN